MMPHQLVNSDSHASSIHIRIWQTFGSHQRDTRHNARIAIAPPEILDIMPETSARVATLRLDSPHALRAKVSPLAILDAGDETSRSALLMIAVGMEAAILYAHRKRCRVVVLKVVIEGRVVVH
jgi:hypothetical protein